MTKKIIHLGLHKTATTFLQTHVWPIVPNFTCMTRPFTQHNHAFNQLQYADDSLYEEQKLISFFDKFHNENIILSDESFSGKPLAFSSINRSQIARRLKRLLPDAEVVLFLRDQKSIIKSQYSAYIKMPYGKKCLDEFIYKPHADYSYEDYLKDPHQYNMESLYYNTNDIFLHLDCFKYSRLIELYQSLFDKVHIFLYEDFVDEKPVVFKQLKNILGTDFTPLTNVSVNKSPDEQQLELKRKANIVSDGLNNRYLRKFIELIIRSTNRSVSESDNLSTQIDLIVGDYYVDDNAKLKAMLPEHNWSNHVNLY
ncbi:MAG: hypothetical protein OCD00_13115 [Colwellia sp.]